MADVRRRTSMQDVLLIPVVVVEGVPKILQQFDVAPLRRSHRWAKKYRSKTS
jgi:hypothetical protein